MQVDLALPPLGILAVVLIGFSKTGMPPAGILAVPVLAAAFPAKLSVGAALPLAVCGDLLAVWYRGRHADRRELWRFSPGCLLGLVAGTYLLTRVSNAGLRPLLGALVLGLLALEWPRRRLTRRRRAAGDAIPFLVGGLAGFASTIGNAAGPIVSIGLVARGYGKDAIVGTVAWFFLVLNAVKLPLYYRLQLITPETLLFDVLALPALLVGGALGIYLLPRLPQRVFEGAVYALAAISAALLIVG